MRISQGSRDAKLLLSIARLSLEAEVARRTPKRLDLSELPPGLGEPRGCFVTLRQGETLRGCIGSIEASRPLAFQVAEQARGAGFRDPRFPALQAPELEKTGIEISVLSPPEDFSVATRSALLDALVPEVDGLVLQDRQARAVFLPAVWKQLTEPDAFLKQLMLKAGLAEDHWSDDLVFSRFRTDSIHEE